MPSVYVGTYAKYNSGNLTGAWIDLEVHTESSFYDACVDLHADEEDPEFMFQDYEGFPGEYYGESHLDVDLWQWLELNEYDREMLAAAVNCFGSITIGQAREAWRGKYRSKQDYAYQFADDSGYLNEMPDFLRRYFDYEAFARDLFINDVIFDPESGHVFLRNW